MLLHTESLMLLKRSFKNSPLVSSSLFSSPKSNHFGVQCRNMHGYTYYNHARSARGSHLKIYSNKIHSEHNLIDKITHSESDLQQNTPHSFRDIVQSIGNHDQLLIVLVGIPGLHDRIDVLL